MEIPPLHIMSTPGNFSSVAGPAAPREDRSGSDSGFVTSLAGSLPKVQFRDVLTGGGRRGDGGRMLFGSWVDFLFWVGFSANLMGVHTYRTIYVAISCVFVLSFELAVTSWKVRVLGICSVDPVVSLKSHASLA